MMKSHKTYFQTAEQIAGTLSASLWMLLFGIKPVKYRESFDGWTLDIAPDANNKLKTRSLAKGSAALDPDRQLPAVAMCIRPISIGGIDVDLARCTILK